MDRPWMPLDPAFSVPTVSTRLDGQEAVGAGQGQAYAYIPSNAAGPPESPFAHCSGPPTHSQGSYSIQSDASYAPNFGYSHPPPPNPPFAPPSVPSPYSTYAPPAHRPAPAPSLPKPSPSAYYGPSLPLPLQQRPQYRHPSHPPSTPREAHLPVAPLPAAQHRPSARVTQYLHPPPPPVPRAVQPVDPGFAPQKQLYNQFDAVPAMPPAPPAAQYRPSAGRSAADCAPVESARRIKDSGLLRPPPHPPTTRRPSRQSPSLEGDAGRYEDTLSAAIDQLDQLGLGENSPQASTTRAAASERLHAKIEYDSMLLCGESAVPGDYKSETLRCDVCLFACGIGTVLPAFDDPANNLMTVEVICSRCDALFKCCSDCGGGGGRLTPELFPLGRKTCTLSHARNPALGEVLIDVLSVADIPAEQLEDLVERCRSIYFNSRLAVIARPGYLLHGDGLARTYQQAERVTVDHWSLLSTLFKLEDQPAPDTNVKRYLTVLYSIPRKRHPRKDSKKKATQPAEKVAFGFSIAHVDFSDSTIFFCCVMPWSVNGQAFDATTLLGEETTRRAKADLFVLNQQRALATPPLPPLPRLTYNYCISPFRAGSRCNVTMPRRGFETLEALAERDPELRREWFPPLKEIWLPAKYAAALQVFVRRLESEDDMGGPPPENTPRKRVRKATSSGTSSAPPSTDNSPFPSYPAPAPALLQDTFAYPPFADTCISFDSFSAPQHPYGTPLAYQQDVYPPGVAQYP